MTTAVSIRIFPMNKDLEFGKPIPDVQRKYFAGELLNGEDCRFFVRNVHLRTPKGTLLLFQYSAHVIASGILKEIEQYEHRKNGIYAGALLLHRDSIRTFKPIDAATFRECCPTFRGFNQSSQIIDIGYLPQIRNLIESANRIQNPEEIVIASKKEYEEGSVASVLVNKYERNLSARAECISEDGTACSICGFGFGAAYGFEFNGRIQVHHLIPLSEIKSEYRVDPRNDLIPVCPNCHFIIHSRTPPLDPAETRGFVQRSRIQEKRIQN